MRSNKIQDTRNKQIRNSKVQIQNFLNFEFVSFNLPALRNVSVGGFVSCILFLFVSCILFLVFSAPAEAATCNDQADGNWNNTATWDCGLVPDADDDVTIDSHIVSIVRDESVRIATTSGGVLNMGTSTLSSYGDWIFVSGTLNAGTSRLTFSNTGMNQTYTPGTAQYYNLRINKDHYALNVSGTARVLNELRISGNTNSNFIGGIIEVEGDVVVDTTAFHGGTSVIKLVGDNNQLLISAGGEFPSLAFDKTGGVVNISGTIKVNGNWTWTSGKINAGTSTIEFSSDESNGLHTIFTPGPIDYYNIYHNKGNYNTTLQSNLKVRNELKIATNSSGGSFLFGSYVVTTKDFVQTLGIVNLQTGALKVTGNFIRTGGTFTYGTSVVSFLGSNQTITSTTTGTTFYKVYKLVNAADTLTITSGSTLTIASGGVMRFWGKPEGKTLSIVSSNPGTPYTITRTGTAELEYTNWSDATWSAAQTAAASSLGTGNTNLTVTKEFISTIRATGGDYSTLSGWEAAVNCDLTAATTKVFSHSGITGTMPDNMTVTGMTSNATGTAVHVTATQILIKNISGTFQSGEQVRIDGSNYVTITDAGFGAIAVAHPYNDWPTGLSDYVTISGWTTDSTHFVYVYVPRSQRHDGYTWTNSTKTIFSGFALNPNAAVYAITGSQGLTRVDGVIVDARSAPDYIGGVYIDGTGGGGRIGNSIAFGGNSTGKAGFNAYLVYNCIIFDFYNGINQYSGAYIYTSTAVDNTGAGINANSISSMTGKNLLAYSNASDFSSWADDSGGLIYSASSDATADDNTIANTGARINQTFTYKDETNDDFHLTTGDKGARDHGTDLSIDPNFPIIDDIDGETRPVWEPWDIGADEYYPTTNATMGGAGTKGAPPIAWYKFDEGYGGVAHNSGSGGSALNGSLQPGTTGDNTASSSMWDKGGKFSGAMEFDGVDDYLNISDNAALNPTSAISLSAWVKSDSAGGYIIAKDPPSSDKAQASPDRVQVSSDQAQVQYEIEKKAIASQTSKTEKIKNYAKNHKDILVITVFFYLALCLLGIYKLKSQVIGDKLVISALALSGAAALIYEVAATQALTYFFNSSSYSVATAIISFLLGLALGSFIISKYLPKIIHPIRLLIVMQILAGIYALLVFPQYYQIVSVLPFFYDMVADSSVLTLGIKFFVGIIFLLFPTIMLGASFPLASSLIIKDVKTAGSDVGRLYSWDLIGAVLGALVSGFILLPKFGLTIAFAFGAVMNIAAGLLLCNIKKRQMALALLGLALFVPLIIFATGKQNLIAVPAVSGIVEMEPVMDKDILFKKESAFGEILVSNKNERPALAISKIVQCDTNYPPLLKNLNAVLDVLPAQERALDVGLGCGYSASAIASSSNIKNLDIVEINPVLTNTLKYFDNDGLLSNDKVVLNNDDIMHFLARTQNVYDFVNVELNMPSLTQVSPFYSKEYFQLLKQKVSQDGTIRLWVCCGNYEFVKTVYKTLGEVYKDIVIKSDMDGREGKDYYYNTEFIIGAGAKSFKQNEAEKKLQTRVENDQDFRISTLDNQLIGEIWYDWSQDNYKDYFVQPAKTVQAEKPQIEDAYLFPLDVKPGDMMDAGARVLDENGIESVKISFPHEKGEDWVNLELSEGTIYDGLWKGEWLAHDTIDKTYLSRLVAENKEGVTEEKVIEWSDFAVPACNWVILDGPYTADVGSTVSVYVDMVGDCGTIYLADNTSGSYAVIPATDTDLDCNGDVCSSNTAFTRNIKCEAAGVYNINATNFGSYQSGVTTVTCKSTGKSDVPYALSTENGGQFLIKSGGTDYTVTADTDINDGEWHHLAGTYDGSAMKLFVDGRLEDTNTDFSGDLPVVAGDLHIGADYEEDPGNFFDGSIDEVKIFNYALTADQVKLEYAGGSALSLGGQAATGNSNGTAVTGDKAKYCVPGDTAVCTPPVLELDFEERTGTTTYDTSGNGNNGVFATAATSPQRVRGREGYGLNLDGVDDYLKIPNAQNFLDPDEGSISIWFKSHANLITNNHSIFRYNVGGCDAVGLSFLAYDANRIWGSHYSNCIGTNDYASTSIETWALDQSVWHNCTLTWKVSTDKLNMACDGKSNIITTSLDSNGTFTTGDAYISYGTTNAFNGLIDKVRIYNYARTPAQIAWDYNRGKPMAEWRFDEGMGTTLAHNSVSNSLHGTMYNMETADWVTGKFGKALDFNGTNEYVGIGDTNLNLNAISFYINSDQLTDDIIDLDGGTHKITVSNGTISATGFASPSVYVDGKLNNKITTGNWHHVMIKTATSFEASAMNIGRISTGYFDGRLDAVKLFSYEPTVEQIKLDMSGGAVRF